METTNTQQQIAELKAEHSELKAEKRELHKQEISHLKQTIEETDEYAGELFRENQKLKYLLGEEKEMNQRLEKIVEHYRGVMDEIDKLEEKDPHGCVFDSTSDELVDYIKGLKEKCDKRKAQIYRLEAELAG